MNGTGSVSRMLDTSPKQERSSKMLFAERSNGKDIDPPKAWSPSDHFDGKRFFNPTLPKDFAPSRRSTLKMVREPRSRWPTWVENKGVPRLNELLGANEVAITFVNHATFLIQTGAITILTDPVWSERASPFRRLRSPSTLSV